MEIRKKTAIVVTGMNIGLTAAKFILFAITGSLVILAEAWHSFSDIATSLLVLFAVSRRGKEADGSLKQGNSAQAGPDAVPSDTGQDDHSVARGRGTWNLEMKVSFGIGIFLLIVSLLLIRQVVWGEKVAVNRPVLAGLIFLGFAIGSYLISRFEGNVGQRSNSVGLISDSKHARADMIASLLAGFSLILYGLGLDLDRAAAFIISLFIFSFSFEVMINVFLARGHGQSDYLFRIKSYHIIGYVFEPRKLYALISDEEFKGLSFFDKKWFRISFGYFMKSIPLLLLLGYLSTCFYMVGTQNQALVLRFGKATSTSSVGPGLHLKMPWPIDRVRLVDVRSISGRNIGNIADAQSSALLWTRAHGTEEAFLTGDNYFIFPYITIHYRIKDIRAYLFQFEDPLLFVENLANQCISKRFAITAFYDIVTVSRSGLSQDLLDIIQSELDAVQAGIEIIGVHFKDIHPPISIADSFEQVIAAMQEKERTINEAHGYKNKNIPEARGQSIRQVEQAHSRIVEQVERASGEARRFVLQNEIFSRNGPVLSQKMYLDMIMKSLSSTNKVIYDPKAGQPTVWFGNKEPLMNIPWQGGSD